MEFLGIGPLELFFIVIIALIILGPKDMVKAGRTLGKFVRQIITSENWRMIQQASQQMRTLPNKFIRDAGLDDIEKELTQAADGITKGIGQSASELSKNIKEATSIQADLGLGNKPGAAQSDIVDLSDWTTPPSTPTEAGNPSDSGDAPSAQPSPTPLENK